MKKLFVTLALGIIGASCHAQWIVYDPVSNIQQILDETENLAEFGSMVDNQVQQISELSQQVQQLEQYNQAFGNPALVVNVTGTSAVTADLTQTPLGLTISTGEKSSEGTAAC